MKQALTPLQVTISVVVAICVVVIIGVVAMNGHSAAPTAMSPSDAKMPGVKNSSVVWTPPTMQGGPPPGSPAQQQPAQ